MRRKKFGRNNVLQYYLKTLGRSKLRNQTQAKIYKIQKQINNIFNFLQPD